MKFKKLTWSAKLWGGVVANDPWRRFSVVENPVSGKGFIANGIGENDEWAEAKTLEEGKQICQKVLEHIMAQWVES